MSSMSDKITPLIKAPEPKSRLDIRDATRLINTLAKDSAKIFLLPHARQREQQRDFIRKDIEEILRYGMVYNEPVKDEHGCWRYLVKCPRFRGIRDAAAVTVIQKDDNLVIITVEWVDTNGRV